jgi:hypothetical protein
MKYWHYCKLTGFLLNHSCLHSLLIHLFQFTSDNGFILNIVMISTDLTKAFSTAAIGFPHKWNHVHYPWSLTANKRWSEHDLYIQCCMSTYGHNGCSPCSCYSMEVICCNSCQMCS